MAKKIKESPRQLIASVIASNPERVQASEVGTVGTWIFKEKMEEPGEKMFALTRGRNTMEMVQD